MGILLFILWFVVIAFGAAVERYIPEERKSIWGFIFGSISMAIMFYANSL